MSDLSGFVCGIIFAVAEANPKQKPKKLKIFWIKFEGEQIWLSKH
jgi:hypothetical protein